MNIGNLLIAMLSGAGALFLLLGVLHLRHAWENRGNKLPLTKRYLRPPGESLRLTLEAYDGKLLNLSLWLAAACAFLGVGIYASLTDSGIVGAPFILVAISAIIYLARSPAFYGRTFLMLGLLIHRVRPALNDVVRHSAGRRPE